VNRIEEIDSLIEAVEKKLVQLDDQRAIILDQLDELKQQRLLLIKQNPFDSTSQANQTSATNHSSESEKIALFRSMFRGREDVFARRFESAMTGKSGYQPCCRNDWVQGICQKPKVKCTDCNNRDFIPVTDGIINFSSPANKNHWTAHQMIAARFFRMILRHRALA
jgi:hypothetical protein